MTTNTEALAIEALAKGYGLKEETIRDLFEFINQEPGGEYEDSYAILEAVDILIESISNI